MTIINEYGETVLIEKATYRSVFEFAVSYRGLNKSEHEARMFIERWKRACSQGSFREFVRAYSFAFSQEGLDYTSQAAEEFAFSWVGNFPSYSFSVFLNFYRRELRRGKRPGVEELFEGLRQQCEKGAMYKEITYEHGSYSEDGNKELLSITAVAGKDGAAHQ